LGSEKGSLDVGPEGAFVVLFGNVSERHKFATARIGEQDIDAPLGVLHRREQPIKIVEFRDVALDAEGVGVARAIQQDVQSRFAAGELVEILPDFALPEVPVHLIYSEQGILPLKLRAFLNFMAPRLRIALKMGADAKI
jgi:DNA-binding transcriptional LysR family regulator